MPVLGSLFDLLLGVIKGLTSAKQWGQLLSGCSWVPLSTLSPYLNIQNSHLVFLLLGSQLWVLVQFWVLSRDCFGESAVIWRSLWGILNNCWEVQRNHHTYMSGRPCRIYVSGTQCSTPDSTPLVASIRSCIPCRAFWVLGVGLLTSSSSAHLVGFCFHLPFGKFRREWHLKRVPADLASNSWRNPTPVVLNPFFLLIEHLEVTNSRMLGCNNPIVFWAPALAMAARYLLSWLNIQVVRDSHLHRMSSGPSRRWQAYGWWRIWRSPVDKKARRVALQQFMLRFVGLTHGSVLFELEPLVGSFQGKTKRKTISLGWYPAARWQFLI